MTQFSFNSGAFTYYDLTTRATGNEALIDGAVFRTLSAEGSSGTGLIQAFVRLSTNADTSDGYNTSERPLAYDENSSPSFTKSIKLDQVPVVSFDPDGPGGPLGVIAYYEFRLDINQTNSNPLISLNELKLYKSTNGTESGLITTAGFLDNTTLVWDMDDQNLTVPLTDDINNTILLDYSLQAGSGKSDMFFYVPVADFGGAVPADTWIVLYSSFGETDVLDAADVGAPVSLYGDYSTNDGFEEWSVSKALGDTFISGYKWHDLDGDGTWDANEPGLGGWQISYSYSTSGKDKADFGGQVTTSDGNTDVTGDGKIDPLGFYAIPVEGTDKTYTITVTETIQEGWINTYSGDLPANDGTTQITFDRVNALTTKGDFGVTEELNFGNFDLFQISGVKYNDLDGDKTSDGGTDPGLAGWTIFIDANNDGKIGGDTDNDGVLDAGETWTEKTAITGAGGAWTITGLDATYDNMVVKEINQAGWVQTFGPVNTIDGTSGNDQSGFDFGNFDLFQISGVKYNDLNGNGKADAGEGGLAGWTIFIDANNDGKIGGDTDNDGVLDAGETWTEKTAITGAGGAWTITGLDATYNNMVVKEINQAGWVQTFGPVSAIVATSGNDQSGFNFGNFDLFQISGVKYNDLNGNGKADAGEGGLAGWTIFIDANNDGKIGGDTDNDGVLDAGETWTEKTAITGAGGAWTITGLDATYNNMVVKEINQAGWVQTFGPVSGIVATSGNDQSGFNFGNFDLFQISGVKYNDLNGNGKADAGEGGLAGWTIFIDANNDGKIGGDTDNDGVLDAGEIWTEKTAITGAGGAWTITGLDATYNNMVVKEINQAGWVQTFGPVSGIVATSGNDQTGFDFGNLDLFDISGVKYNDLNGNGKVDAGEGGLAGWTIFIDANNDGKIGGDTDNDGVLDAGETWTEKTAITGAGGAWTITGLDATYDNMVVKEINQAGWVQTFGPVNTIDGTSGNDQSGFDFGNFDLFQISGVKYNDLNGNGKADAGEGGLAGWTIFIDANNDGKIGGDTDNDGVLDAGEIWTEKTAITGAGGAWTITGLDASYDNMVVKEINQAGWVQTFGPVNTIDATSGNDQSGFNFGNFDLFQISGVKYNDLDGDKTSDGGTDPGLAGWTIFIDANNDGKIGGDTDNDGVLDAGEIWTEKTAITGAGGAWTITGLDASYNNMVVKEINQAGWVQTFGPVSAIVATSGNDQSGFNFGNFDLFQISGKKVEDLNGNGKIDAGDPGLAGWTIFIDANNDGKIGGDTDNDGVLDAGEIWTEKTAITGAGGAWTITGLDASYNNMVVKEINQAGWVQTSAQSAASLPPRATTRPGSISPTSS